jgi:hypothetical protein
MRGLVPRIHVVVQGARHDVGGRHKAGQDDNGEIPSGSYNPISSAGQPFAKAGMTDIKAIHLFPNEP